MITVTKGQWFPLTIGNIRYGGAAFDLQGATEVSASLVSTLGMKSPLSFEITAFNEISAVCDGTLSAGKYGIEVSCKGADGKAYRMKSPGAIIEVSASTTSSTGSTAVRVAGDEWELTADVEMHEGQARTYMSLLEEARKAAIKAADDAEAVIDNVQSSVSQAQEAAKVAQQASTNAEEAVTKANNAVSDANNALQSITTMEGTVNTAEQGRKDAESERITAEQGREDAESERITAEQGREEAENERVTAEQGRKDAESERVTAEQGREKEMSDYMLVIKKPIVSTSEVVVVMDANKFYDIKIGRALVLDINPPQDTAITNDWEGCFDTGSSAPTVTWPGNVNWGTSYMTLAINMHYEFSIRQSGDKLYGILYGWSLD